MQVIVNEKAYRNQYDRWVFHCFTVGESYARLAQGAGRLAYPLLSLQRVWETVPKPVSAYDLGSCSQAFNYHRYEYS